MEYDATRNVKELSPFDVVEICRSTTFPDSAQSALLAAGRPTA